MVKSGSKDSTGSIFTSVSTKGLQDLADLQWLQRFNALNPEHSLGVLDRLGEYRHQVEFLCSVRPREYKNPDAEVPSSPNPEFQNFPNFSSPNRDGETWGAQLDREAEERKDRRHDDFTHGLG